MLLRIVYTVSWSILLMHKYFYLTPQASLNKASVLSYIVNFNQVLLDKAPIPRFFEQSLHTNTIQTLLVRVSSPIPTRLYWPESLYYGSGFIGQSPYTDANQASLDGAFTPMSAKLHCAESTVKGGRV